jgi:Reverse transcriptase (RNA-dependent DNA polymerase)
MKKYYEYMDEISPTELLESLVGHGLFAEKLPSFLDSVPFLSYIKTQMSFPYSDDKPKDYIRYSNTRNINVPRQLSIPEPFAYADQCKILGDNWTNLNTYFKDLTHLDPYKVSRIHLRKMHNKSNLFEMNYKNISKDGDPEQDIIIRSKYIACADISNCFPSIYSHSIVWALITKPVAKTSKNPSLWHNQIDFYTRNLKYGETNGVLIGPHSSNLISEIILVKVDKELVSNGYKFIRHIDDYMCYARTNEEAEKFFIDLSEILKGYELSLNHKKSKILPLPHASVKDWLTKLNHFNFPNTYTVGGKEALRVKELLGFIDFSVELMIEENSDASILNYAVKIISQKHLDKNAIDYYSKRIHHLVLLYPYLVTLLEEYVFDTHKFSKKQIQLIAEDIYELGMSKKMYEPCAYAIYWALKYDFTLSAVTIKQDAINSLDCIFLLISHCYDKKNHPKVYLKEYRDLAIQLKKDEFDRYWLYIYEVLSWSEQISKYKDMKKSGITFIKSGFI